MFTTMMDGIKEESVGSLFNLQVQVQQNPIVEEARPARTASRPRRPAWQLAAPPVQPPARQRSRSRRPGQQGPAAAARAPASARRGRHRAGSRPLPQAARRTATVPRRLRPALPRGLARPKRAGRSATAHRARTPPARPQHTTGQRGRVRQRGQERAVPVRVRAASSSSATATLATASRTHASADRGAAGRSVRRRVRLRLTRGRCNASSAVPPAARPAGSRHSDPQPPTRTDGSHLDHARRRGAVATRRTLGRWPCSAAARARLIRLRGLLGRPRRELLRRPGTGQRLGQHLGELSRPAGSACRIVPAARLADPPSWVLAHGPGRSAFRRRAGSRAEPGSCAGVLLAS